MCIQRTHRRTLAWLWQGAVYSESAILNATEGFQRLIRPSDLLNKIMGFEFRATANRLVQLL